MLKRHAIQVLRQAGHTLDEIAEQVAVGKRTVQRVVSEPMITHHDTEQARAVRAIGRPSKAEAYRATVVAWLTEEPHVLSVELLRCAQLAGYAGGKSALYDLVAPSGLALRGPWCASRACRGNSRSMILARCLSAFSMGRPGASTSLPRASSTRGGSR